MRNNPVLLDRCWSWLAMGLVGQELDDRDDIICGAGSSHSNSLCLLNCSYSDPAL